VFSNPRSAQANGGNHPPNRECATATPKRSEPSDKGDPGLEARKKPWALGREAAARPNRGLCRQPGTGTIGTMKPFYTHVIRVTYEWHPPDRGRADRTRMAAAILYPPEGQSRSATGPFRTEPAPGKFACGYALLVSNR